MAVLSVLLVLCVILLVGVARHSRCASYLMARVYLASSVALEDLCVAPEKFLDEEASPELPREIIRCYTSCERASANPFTQRLREAKSSIEGLRAVVTRMKKPADDLYPGKVMSVTNDRRTLEEPISGATLSDDCPPNGKYATLSKQCKTSESLDFH